MLQNKMKNNFKYTFLLCLLGLGMATNAQILVPKFDQPVRIESINSDAEEVAPVPYMNGEKLYFVRTYVNGKAKERKKGQEIWQSERKNGVWSEPHSLFEEANDRGNNGVIGSSKDGNRVYAFNSIQSRRKLARGVAYVDKQGDGSWGDLEKLEIEGFDIGEGYYSFCMNNSEDVLIISMPSENNTTKEDLYVSVKENNQWSTPVNLGSVINTSGFETSPYLAEDKKTLYFASDGHGGLGDADIFMSYRQGDSWTDWTKPLNLGAPINSPSFDAYFTIGNNEEVFFVSNRNSTYSDIYTTKISENASVQPSNAVTVNGQFNYNGLPAENVSLEIYDANGNLVDEVVTDAYGRFTYQKLNPEEDYIVKIAAEDKDEYPNSFVYIVDEEGNKLQRLSMLENGVYTEELVDKTDTELISGVYEYNELPMSKAALVILDENGYPLDTFYTDEKGNFEYYKLKEDKNYTLIPLDVQDVLLDNANIYLTDDKGNKLDKEVFKKPAKKDLAAKDEKGTNTPSKPKQEEKKEEESSKDQQTIFFAFNEYELTGDDIGKLDKVKEVLDQDKSKKVRLVGHTDNVGSAANNLKVAKWRADAAKRYLVSKGVRAARVLTSAEGESKPRKSNDTAEGRNKNRRVEIEIK